MRVSKFLFSHHLAAMFISGVVGVVLAIAGYFLVANFAHNRAETAFYQTATNRIASIERHIESAVGVVDSLGIASEISPDFEIQDFAHLTKHFLARSDSLQALEWIPRVPLSERDSYEQALRRAGYSEFQFTERNAQGELTRAETRPEYFPVYFIAPYEDNAAAHGFDLASNPVRLAALNQARDSGESAVSGRITLVQETGTQYGVLVFAPSYREDLNSNNLEIRREKLVGFALGVIRIGDLIARASANTTYSAVKSPKKLNTYVFDADAEPGEALLHMQPAESENPTAPALSLAVAQKGIHLENSITIGGRTWTIVIRPAVEDIATDLAWQSWLVAAVILVFTGLIIGYIQITGRRWHFTERLVREQTEDLRESESRIQAVVDHILDGIITIDALGKVETFNPAAERMFGYQREEVIGKNVKILMPDYYAGEHDGYLGNYRLTHERKIIGIGREVTGLRKDGSTFPLDLAVSEMRIDGQQIYTGILRDITERNQAESLIRERTEELRESENRVQEVVDHILDGIITIDALGRVETFNPAAERMFGYQREEVIGKNVKVLMPNHYAIEHDGYLSNYRRTHERKIIGIGREVTGLRKDGSTFPMDLAVSEMWVDGQQKYTGILRDITERKQAERMKSEFVSTVSHELRTPLTSIQGSLGLIRSGVVGELSEKLRGMIDIAFNNCDRLVRLINDILDIEKIEAGRMAYAFGPVALRPLLEQVIKANEDYAKKFSARYTLYGEIPDITLNADSDRLMQVLTNLLSNAAKFSPDGEEVLITATADDTKVRVSVTDCGGGIPEEFKDRIFGKFAQADSSDTRQKGGTGLGLNISKTIIEAHDGAIGFDSETGKGTTFYFDLPVWHDINEDSDEVAVDRRNNQATVAHVLICEDDRDIAKLISMTIAQDGYTADIAYDAKTAKEMLAKNTYAAMTLDLHLPDQDGLSLIRELQMEAENFRVPIIVISGRAKEAKKRPVQDSQDGTDSVLEWLDKPIDTERLLQGLAAATQQNINGHIRILHVEDDVDVRRIIAALIGDAASVTTAGTVARARKILEKEIFDLMILDLGLPDGEGAELLALTKVPGRPHIPVIVFSARELSNSAAMQVSSALVKSQTSNEKLLDTIESCINERREQGRPAAVAVDATSPNFFRAKG